MRNKANTSPENCLELSKSEGSYIFDFETAKNAHLKGQKMDYNHNIIVKPRLAKCLKKSYLIILISLIKNVHLPKTKPHRQPITINMLTV